MKNLQTLEEFLNESKTWKIEDFPINSIIKFKDKEEWIVVKPGMRSSGSIRKVDENKLAKDIRFVKMVASDLGHTITDADAKKCIKYCKDDYYAIKDYFTV